MINDYRNTEYCKTLNNIRSKKQSIANLIRKDYPSNIDMYKYLHNNNLEYKIKFIEIYNRKCAYCGVSLDIITKSQFEIDHVKNKSNFESEEKAGTIENLVPACFKCNRSKSSFEITDEHMIELHPDYNISRVFVRDNMFYIRISDEFKEDEAINCFYKKLRLGDEFRRLDYLLMSMIGLSKEKKSNELLVAIELLKEKRNRIY